jgi:hypothetical protein
VLRSEGEPSGREFVPFMEVYPAGLRAECCFRGSVCVSRPASNGALRHAIHQIPPAPLQAWIPANGVLPVCKSPDVRQHVVTEIDQPRTLIKDQRCAEKVGWLENASRQSNLFVTMLDGFGVVAQFFGNSAGTWGQF